MADCQLIKRWLTHRHREQARSHKGLRVYAKLTNNSVQTVGAGLLAMADFQLIKGRLTHYHREQAPTRFMGGVA